MEDEIVKLLLVGDEKCGKTTFLSRMSAGEAMNPIPMLRDIDQPFIFSINQSLKRYKFEFYDTSSPDNWRLLDPDVIIICYDISQRLSLINMKRYVSTATPVFRFDLVYKIGQWINEVKKAFPRADGLPIIVMGLKRDLRSERDPNGIIYPQDAYQMAQEMRVDRYVECSAVTGELIEPAFEDICRTAVKTTTEQGGQSEGGCVLM